MQKYDAGGGAVPKGFNESILGGWRQIGLDFGSFRLSLVAKMIDRLAIRYLARETDITIAQWRVLARLSQAPEGLTVREVAANAWVDRAEVSRAVAQLEKTGLACRQVNPADGRMPILFATAKGKAYYTPILEKRVEFHKRAMAGLSPEECEEFDRMLYIIGCNLLRTEAEEEGGKE